MGSMYIETPYISSHMGLTYIERPNISSHIAIEAPPSLKHI